MDIKTIKLLTPAEVQVLLSISYPTLMRWTKKNTIPSMKIGGQLRYPEEYFLKQYKEALEGF